jgi:hypothetical protein
MSRKVKEVIRAAGIRDALTFTSFRHGGFTEAADSDLSDAQMRAAGRHKSAKVLPTYAKRTMKQVIEGARKRTANFSRCSAWSMARWCDSHAPAFTGSNGFNEL